MDCPPDVREGALAAQAAGHNAAEDDLSWWQSATVYQVLVQSFKDANDDGVGDIQGLIDNLDYLVELGVDVVWLSPIFDSPMHDMGYDIRDYTKINSTYGTLEDVDRLIEATHQKGLKIILDIALNHTSTEHEWFQTSRSSRQSPNGPKRDWYIWHPGKEDPSGKRQPPNNWESAFGGSAWTFDEVAGEYYMHIFGETQADINWDNEEARHALYDMLHWWLKRGIDGFRLDCINLVSKAEGFPNAPIVNPEAEVQRANCFFANGPKVHKYLQELHEQVFSQYDIVTIGEMSCGITSNQAVDYISKYKPRPELNLLIQFQHVELDCHDGDKWLLREWELPELKYILHDWQDKMLRCGGWMTLWMENHDQPRGISRFTTSTPRFRGFCAKMLAMWLFTLRGTPLIYQGQELGMINPESFSEDMNQDIETILFWNSARKDEAKIDDAKRAIMQKGRDNTRVPLPWNATHNVGFSESAKPWLPPIPDSGDWCVSRQREDDNSVLAFYQSLIRMRRSHPTLLRGSVKMLDLDNKDTFAFLREYRNSRYLTILNFSPGAVTWPCKDKGFRPSEMRLLLSNYVKQGDQVTDPLILRPYEGLLFELIQMDDGV